MAVTYGFYNAKKNENTGLADRRYDAEEMSSLFDGIITDGILTTIGSGFEVKLLEGDHMTLSVGTGRAWFDHTWTNNDAEIHKTIAMSDVKSTVYSIVIIVDKANRVNRIGIKKGKSSPKGTPPKAPEMTKSTDYNEYCLANLTYNAGTKALLLDDLRGRPEKGGVPFCTGILQQISVDQLLETYKYQAKDFLAGFVDYINKLMDDAKHEISIAVDRIESDFMTLAKSWAVGETGSRIGEDEDNSKYYAQIAGLKTEIIETYLKEIQKIAEGIPGMIDDLYGLNGPKVLISMEDGHIYWEGGRFDFALNSGGHLLWGVA